MAGIGWNKLRITDWMAMAGGVSALVNVLLKVTTQEKGECGIY